MRFPQEPVTIKGSIGYLRASVRHSRFARTGIRPMSLMYPVRYPNPETLVIGIAHDEESASSVGVAASIERA